MKINFKPTQIAQIAPTQRVISITSFTNKDCW